MGNGTTYKDEIQIDIAPGQAFNLDINTRPTAPPAPRGGSVKLTLQLPATQSGGDAPDFSVVLLNTSDRNEIIIPVQNNIAEKEGVPPGNYWVLIDNVPENDTSLTRCHSNNMRRGRIFKVIRDGDHLWDFEQYNRRIERERRRNPWQKGSQDFSKDTFAYGKYATNERPALPARTSGNENMGILSIGNYLCVEQILYDAEKNATRNDGKYQSLRVMASVGEGKEAFVWTVYQDRNYIDYARAESTVEVKSGRKVEGNVTVIAITVFKRNNANQKESFTPYVSNSVTSQQVQVNWQPAPGVCTYPVRPNNIVKFYNDASEDPNGDKGAFRDIEDAINEAQHFVFIADWSFHPYVRLTPKSEHRIGRILSNWAFLHPDGVVAIHTWDHTYIPVFDVGAQDVQNDNGGNIFNRLEENLFGPNSLPNLLWRASSRARTGYSHHQKFVVMDFDLGGGRKGIRAFIGGLDLTKGRFDWPEHPLYPKGDYFEDVRTYGDLRVHEWYSAEFPDADPPPGSYPRQTWHDIHCEIKGPAAWDVVREFVGRWRLDPSSSDALGDDDGDSIKKVVDKFVHILGNNSQFVNQNDPGMMGNADWTAQIYRSMHKNHWAELMRMTNGNIEFEWTLGSKDYEKSIEEAYVNAINKAERFIYIESQYFIGSGSSWSPERNSVTNRIPHTIFERIKEKQNSNFHVYIILPMFPEGNPTDHSMQGIRDLQWRSIHYIIKEMKKVGINAWERYLTIGFLAQWEDIYTIKLNSDRKTRVHNNKRYMIYVHSKMMLIDDQYIIIGSANLNERSLSGDRDSEICVGMWPKPGHEDACKDQIKALRDRLWKEHFGSVSQYWGVLENGIPLRWQQPESYDECAEIIQDIGKNNYSLLNKGSTGNRSGHFCCWEINDASEYLGLRGNEDHKILDGSTCDDDDHEWFTWPHPDEYTDLGTGIE